MIDVNDFIILNCYGTLTNMCINAEILELNKKQFKQESEIMESILEQLKILNEELKNGT